MKIKSFVEKAELRRRLVAALREDMLVEPKDATIEQFYRALASTLRDLMGEKRRHFSARTAFHAQKQVHYLSMEFLPGRSMKNSLYNLCLDGVAAEVLSEWEVRLEQLYECEPDAGLGNGGLGRLAACYLDGLATDGFSATGYSILYKYGIFKQKIIDGWQTEQPDYWIPGGDVWLAPRSDQATEVRFGGVVNDWWESGIHRIEHTGYETVTAVPTTSMFRAMIRRRSACCGSIRPKVPGSIWRNSTAAIISAPSARPAWPRRSPTSFTPTTAIWRARSCGCASSTSSRRPRSGISSTVISRPTGPSTASRSSMPSRSTTPTRFSPFPK